MRLNWRAAGWRAAGLGVLAAGALPPLHLVPVLAFAVPGLLALVGAQRDARRAASIGFWFGFGHHLVGLYWITEAIMIESARFWWLVPIAVPLLAAALAVFIVAPCVAAWYAAPGWRRVLAFAGAWVLSDLARQFFASGFPWNPWGSVWAAPYVAGDVFQQPAAYIGVHGLTLATLLIAATPALGRRAMLGGAAALAAWAGFGIWRLGWDAEAAPGLTAVLVQGNVAQGQKWDPQIAQEQFRRHLDLTHDGVGHAGDGPVVVIWPETAAGAFLLETRADARAAIMDATGGAPALVGSVRFDADRRPRNSLMALRDAGPPQAIYDKWHLVPFGEYQPAWALLPIQVVPGGGFAAGPGPVTMHVTGLPPAGPLICYEAIFSGQVVDSHDRPDWLVNVTNDAWFGNSTGPRQHLAAARLRAVEEGLPLVRAANTGISAVFDAFGRETARLGMDQQGVVVATVPGKLPPTPYARFGLFVPLLAGAASLGLGFVPMRRLRQKVTAS
jgi:apolipoprotein N-acyltransferase